MRKIRTQAPPAPAARASEMGPRPAPAAPLARAVERGARELDAVDHLRALPLFRSGLVFRAAEEPIAPPPRAHKEPVRAPTQSATNETDDFAAAVVVPAGAGPAAGHIVVVGPGESYTAPPGLELRAFLHRDGSAVRFTGQAGGIDIGREQTQAEFSPLLAEARAVFQAHPLPNASPAKPSVVHRDADGPAPSGELSALPATMAASASKPLDSNSRSRLEQSFGTNLSGVRIHTDAAADQAAKSVQAHAFATGQDIYFRSGKYQANTTDGQKLLAHEVAHTVQQGAGATSTQRKADPSELQISEPGDLLEVQADEAAERAVRNQPARLAGVPTQSPHPIARFAETAEMTARSASPLGAAGFSARKFVPTLPPMLDREAGEGAGDLTAFGRAILAAGPLERRAGEQLDAPEPPSEERAEPSTDGADASPDNDRDESASAGAPQVDVGAGGASPAVSQGDEGTALPAPAVQRGRSEGAFDSFGSLTASAMAMRLPSLGQDIAGQFGADRDAVVETAPKLRAFVPGQVAPSKTAAGPAPPSVLPSAEAINPGPATQRDAGLPPAEAGVPPQPDGDTVSTSAGPPPQFVPAGDGDPNQVGTVADLAATTARQGQQSIAAELAANRSANRIVPVEVNRSEGISIPDGTASVSTAASEDMREYLGTDVPGNVRAIADGDLAPTIAASLAAPRQAVAKAAVERDTQREQAFADAQAEADRASLDARAEQSQLIAEGRGQIEAEKARATKESQEKLAKFDSGVQRLRQDKQAEIQQKIDTEQARANNAIADGEAKAAKEQAQANTAVEREQSGDAPAPRMPRMRVFRWSLKKAAKSVGGAISSAGKSVVEGAKHVGGKIAEGAKQVGRVLSETAKRIIAEAKRAVRVILEAAKSIAVGVIQALRTAVVGLVRAFAASVKVLVGGLLVFFPQLRERVNAAIDGIVDATVAVVNKVAEGLETVATSVVDKLESTINRVLDTFELVVVTSIALAQALLTGNFLDAAKILFLAACKAVGIPGEEFLGILADAGGALVDVVKHPASFLGNLLKSVGGGMGKFLANFAQRMVGGLTEWLFGQVAEGGITLPTSFGPEGIFMLVLQVMGVTYAHIRSRVVRQLGEKAVSTIEKVMAPIELMFTKGPGALWEWLKDQAEQAKKAIIEAASQWLITRIITQAVIKLASMFTPVGAFVQAVLMMYNTIMFFVEKIKEIFAWVKSITTSLKNIAVGAIGAAVDYIDLSMSKSIPLIIDFLAKLLGVGGLGGQIRKVVQTLRGPVDKAIDFLITKLIGGAKAAWGGVKAGAAAVKEKVANWWTARKAFTTQAGEQHELYFEGTGKDAQLTIASIPQQFHTYLKALEQSGKVDDKVIFDLRRRYEEIEYLRAHPEPVEIDAQDQRARILFKLTELADILSKMPKVNASFSKEELFERCAVGLGMDTAEFTRFKEEKGIEELGPSDAELLSFAADLNPVSATLKAGAELITGTDPFTGKQVRWWNIVSDLAFAKLSAVASRAIGKVVGKAGRWFSKGLKKGAAKTTGKALEKAEVTAEQKMFSTPAGVEEDLGKGTTRKTGYDASGKDVPSAKPVAGETASTATGKATHKVEADRRRVSGEFDLVQSAIKDKNGNPILVSKRVDLKAGQPQPGSQLQEAIPDAVSFKRRLIVDDKPLGRPLAKDRQEIIRFIEAYKQREGHLPDTIAIQRYDPKTGVPTHTELYSPQDFLP